MVMDKEFTRIFLEVQKHSRNTLLNIPLKDKKLLKRVTVSMSFEIMRDAIAMIASHGIGTSEAISIAMANICLVSINDAVCERFIKHNLVDIISTDARVQTLLENVTNTKEFEALITEFNLSYSLLFYEFKSDDSSEKLEGVDILSNNLVGLMSSVRLVEIENSISYDDCLLSKYSFDNTCLRLSGGVSVANRISYSLDTHMAYQDATLDKILFSINNFWGKNKARGLKSINIKDYIFNTVNSLISYINRDTIEKNAKINSLVVLDNIEIKGLKKMKSENYKTFIVSVHNLHTELISKAVYHNIIDMGVMLDMKKDYPESYIKLVDKMDSETLQKFKERGIV